MSVFRSSNGRRHIRLRDLLGDLLSLGLLLGGIVLVFDAIFGR